MEKREIKIQTDYIKLDQLLKFSGIAETGGEAKEMILQGCVCWQGEVCFTRGKKVYRGDSIIVHLQDQKIMLLVQ